MSSRKSYKKYIRYLPLFGCIATGLIYLAIGVIAILSLMQIKEGGADESSLFVYLNKYVAGKFIVVIILLGTISYILWRIFEAIKDPYEYGSNAKGLALRIGIALSTIADALIAYSAIQTLIGVTNASANGVPDEYRKLVENVLSHESGNWIILITGGIISATAVIQLVYGFASGYKERLDIARFSSGIRHVIHILAWSGYLCRGIILGVTGFFLIKAGILENAHHVVNTDKAFDFIGDHIGHTAFILVAVGTICYGLFMFTLGISYDADKD